MEFQFERNRIFAVDPSGKLLAEITFPENEDGTVNIDHTFVDGSLKGQGIAGKLVEAAARQLRQEGKKVRPTCSYAAAWFEKHPQYKDLLQNIKFRKA